MHQSMFCLRKVVVVEGRLIGRRGGRGGREGNPREIDIEACSLNGDFDSMKPLLQMQLLQRLDGNLTSNEHPGEVNLTFSFPKISNSPGITPPPPSPPASWGKALIGALINQLFHFHMLDMNLFVPYHIQCDLMEFLRQHDRTV